MNPSRPFILRPVATSLLMLAILLAGIIAYRVLPISALPQVDYPTIQVVTLYPGASPDVTTSSITAPLERQFGQMPGLKQMSSTSSAGAAVITLQFDLNLSLDVAEQEVQAAINASGRKLPEALIAACTSCSATSSDKFKSNWSVITAAPAELVDDICFKPGICPNWRSSGAVIDEVVTSGLAPG